MQQRFKERELVKKVGEVELWREPFDMDNGDRWVVIYRNDLDKYRISRFSRDEAYVIFNNYVKYYVKKILRKNS